MTRLIGRYGLTIDPTQAHIRTHDGRLFLCLGFYKKHIDAGDYEVMMLRVQQFNGESHADIPARGVFVLDPANA